MISSTPLLLDIIHELVTAARVKESFENDLDFSLKLENGFYMPLFIEAYPAGNCYQGESRHVRIAHYFVQNGDYVPDPELLMTDSGQPIYVRTTFGLSQVLSKDSEQGTVVDTQAKHGAMELMDIWAEAIRFQNWLKVAAGYKENGGGK